jgi:hypothetical protein
MVGAGLYALLKRPFAEPFLETFRSSLLNIAHMADERTVILQLFIYISLFFTLMTIPCIHLLRREIDRRGIEIDLVGEDPAAS